MPKNKRNRIVHLGKAKKKTKEWKEGLIESARESLDKYPVVYLLRYRNMRNDKFKQLREQLKNSSRFMLGSNKIMQIAFGKTEVDEYLPNLHSFSQYMQDNVCLFFTCLSDSEVQDVFEAFQHQDFARVGSKATEDFELLEGPVEGPHGPLQHTLTEPLRKCGLPVRLNKGVVELMTDYTVCKKGWVLDSNKAAILKVFQVKMATFRFFLVASYTKEGAELKEFEDVDEIVEDELLEDS